MWALSNRASPRGARLADRHYPRRAHGAAQFVAPGSPIVLITEAGNALWVTLNQRPEFVDHAWPGAWNCTTFRNESKAKSSMLISQALAATRALWGDPPAEGLITFIDAEATAKRRSPRHGPGHCFRVVGFVEVATTPGGHGRRPKTVLHLGPELFPLPSLPLGAQMSLEAAS